MATSCLQVKEYFDPMIFNVFCLFNISMNFYKKIKVKAIEKVETIEKKSVCLFILFTFCRLKCFRSFLYSISNNFLTFLSDRSRIVVTYKFNYCKFFSSIELKIVLILTFTLNIIKNTTKVLKSI